MDNVPLLMIGLLTAVAWSGCINGEDPHGLEASPSECPASETVTDGFLVRIDDPSQFIGHCLAIAHDDERIDDDFAFRKVAGDGAVYLPIEGAGDYYISMNVLLQGDPWCSHDVHEFVTHDGTGIVDVMAESGLSCA